MGLFDRITPEARTTLNWKRLKCHTYAECYTYFQQNVKEWEKTLKDNDGDISKVPIWAMTQKKEVEQNSNGEVFLQISVKQMPVYWAMEPVLDKQGKQDTVDIKQWDDASKSLKTLRTENLVMGQPRARVSSLEEGWELIKDLANSEDPDFKQVLTTVAEAIPLFEQARVDTEAYAEVLYEKARAAENATAKFKAMGAWDDGDEAGAVAGSMKTSSFKTVKKNQYKSSAKRILGHARVTDTREGFR